MFFISRKAFDEAVAKEIRREEDMRRVYEHLERLDRRTHEMELAIRENEERSKANANEIAEWINS